MNFHYTPRKLLSYNALFNFVNGERGVGKSFGFKTFTLDQFLKNGYKFVYVRRYKTELEHALFNGTRPSFYDKIQDLDKYKNFSLSNTKDTFKVNKKICGYAISLTTAPLIKSSEFKNVKYIIFDEYQILKGTNYHYLKNEVTQFLELYESIARMNDVKVFFLGNSMSISNPYFNYFNIHMPYNSNYAKFNNGLIVVEYIKNIPYREAKKKTKFGQLIDGTAYGLYAIDNINLQDDKRFISKKSDKSRFLISIVMSGIKYGLWFDDKEMKLYISRSFNPNSKNIFTLSENDNSPDVKLMTKNNYYYKMMILFYSNSALFFETVNIKNIFIDYII